MASPTADLLSLGEAAQRLGVHPTTLRRWADEGDVLVMVTPGGHRRFPVAEIERLRGIGAHADDEAVVAEQLVARALVTTRVHLPEHAGAGWVAGFDDEERRAKRESGRRLMALLQAFLAAAPDQRASILDEVRRIGLAYAQDARAHGLGLTDVLRAVTFFRDQTIEGALSGGNDTSDSQAARSAIQQVNAFYNAALLAVAEVFD